MKIGYFRVMTPTTQKRLLQIVKRLKDKEGKAIYHNIHFSSDGNWLLVQPYPIDDKCSDWMFWYEYDKKTPEEIVGWIEHYFFYDRELAESAMAKYYRRNKI